MKPKVLVVGGNVAIEDMFARHNFDILKNSEREKHPPDLVCFTGGEDIDPALYGEHKLKFTWFNKGRDDREIKVFNEYKEVPKVGICRGGQFLNVMSGGEMWQDVDNHTRDHYLSDLLFGQMVKVTSTHHQMMIPGEDAEIIAICEPPLATTYKSAKSRVKPKFDTEVLWYDKTNSLCFQPHPEYSRVSDCTEYFFELIEYFWGDYEDKK